MLTLHAIPNRFRSWSVKTKVGPWVMLEFELPNGDTADVMTYTHVAQSLPQGS